MPTPWSSSGSLVSDRIRPHAPPPKQQQQQNRVKGKGKAPTPEPPKSRDVRILEARLDGARGSNGRAKDPKGGCFCQARNHALSDYVSICRRCGLILCALNLPYYACPHCTAALLDEREREALITRLDRELAEQLAKEEAERQRAIEEARVAEGAFPMLPASQIPNMKASRTPPTPATTRMVLSLNSETKKVRVSSYCAPTVTLPRPESREEGKEEEGRVSRPPEGIDCVTEPVDPGRPWRNVRSGDVRYVPLPASGEATGDTSRRGRRKKGGDPSAAGTEPDE